MATLTMTVRNTLRLYGVEPHNKWGSLVWGTSTWAQQDVQWRDYKLVTDALSVGSSQKFKVQKLIADSFALGSTISRRFPAWVAETLHLDSAITAVYRVNNGWYVKRGDELNALEYSDSGFTKVAAPATTWTKASEPSTTWTKL